MSFVQVYLDDKEENPNDLHPVNKQSDPFNALPAIEEINTDELLKKYVGAFGFWQWMIILLCVSSAPSMATLPVFVNAVPDIRCRMEEKVETYFNSMNLTFKQIRDIIGPHTGCSRYSLNWTDQTIISDMTNRALNLTKYDQEKCPYGYTYKQKIHQYTSTIVIDFDLVCSHQWIGPLGTFLYMVGMLIGFVVGGCLGDEYGRRRTAILFTVIEIGLGIGVSLAPNHYVYHIMRTLVGATNTGKASVLRVLPLELTLAEYRGYFGSITTLALLSIHRMILSGWAYLISDWRWLNAAGMMPGLFGLLFFCLLPESPRWLNSQRRPREAVEVLLNGLKFNQLCSKNKDPAKRAYLESLLNRMPLEDSRKLNLKAMCMCCNPSLTGACEIHKPSFLNLTIVRNMVVCALLWAGQTFCLFGLLLYARVIEDSIQMISLINAAMAIPGPVLASVIYRLCKRRRLPLLVCIFAIFVSLVVGGFYTLYGNPSNDILLTVCCNIALFLLAATMVMAQIYLTELFPSIIRSRAVGISSGIGRLGSSVSTFANQLDETVKHGTPILIYAAVSLIMGCLMFCIPDTTGKDLPDFVNRGEVVADEKD